MYSPLDGDAFGFRHVLEVIYTELERYWQETEEFHRQKTGRSVRDILDTDTRCTLYMYTCAMRT